MKITFKDVGQGDSILLEWQEDGINKIGIIDCSRKQKDNPVLEHLKISGYKEIEFIILSHPHSDHYSGMAELFDYIKEYSILVRKFAHTLFILGQDFFKYLKWAEIETAAMEDLKNLVKGFDDLRKLGLIRKLEFITENWHQELKEGIFLKCLSPSQLEAEEYMRLVKLEPEKNKKRASSSANFLSTLFSLVIGDEYYLLTSDSETFTFERLIRQNDHKELVRKRLRIGQLPHHGSSKNYHEPFWGSLQTSETRHVVASAGVHMTYQHPHLPVLQSFMSGGYQIHCTNIVHGMKEFVDLLQTLRSTSDKLDTFTELMDSYSGGDKVFDLLIKDN